MDLAYLYATLLTLGVGLLLSRVAIRPSLIFQYPYFIAAVFAVFILPQVVSLLRFPGRVSDGAVADVMLMSCLCLGCAVVGYRLTPSVAIFKRVARPVDDNRMLHIGIVFIAIGILFNVLWNKIKAEQGDVSELTGIATIYLFLANLAYPGFAIALMLYVKKHSATRLVATLIGGVIPLLSVVYGRREPAAMVCLIIVLGRYFTRRIEPPRVLVFSGLVFAMLAIPATGTYRGLFNTGQYEAIKEIDLLGNFSQFLNEESILELRNAAAMIESTKRFKKYDYGLDYWNQIVFRFVPAQIVGKKLKDSLMLGESAEAINERLLKSGYEFSRGSTLTGMGDSFKHFGWFGCLFFVVIAVVFRSIWLAAHRQNAFFAQLLYLGICTSGMRAVTHQTLDFLPGLIYQSVFLGLGLLYAGKKREKTLPPTPPPSAKPQGGASGGDPRLRSGYGQQPRGSALR